MELLDKQTHTGSWKRITNGASSVSFLGLQVNLFIFLGYSRSQMSGLGHTEAKKLISHLVKQCNFFSIYLQWRILIHDRDAPGECYVISPWLSAYSYTLGLWMLWMSALLSGSPCYFPTLSTSGPEWGSMDEKGKLNPDGQSFLLGLSTGSPK